MAERRVHARIEGIVQGVWFRDSTRSEAERLGLAGWVRNLADGAVEVEAEGEAPQIAEMIRWLHKGPPQARVSGVEVREVPVRRERPPFVIRYDC